MKAESVIFYKSIPQCLDICPRGGPEKGKTLAYVLNSLLEAPASVQEIGFMDDVHIPEELQSCGLLSCPDNADSEVKAIVQQKAGFISKKPSTAAVVELLEDYYPIYWRNHRKLHSLWFDMDGCIWREEKVEEDSVYFSQLAQYIQSAQGYFSARPPISIITGAPWEAVRRVLEMIDWLDNIPEKSLWPSIIFEAGALLYNVATQTIIDLTEEKYGLVSSDFSSLSLIIKKIGEAINKKVPEINQLLGGDCRVVAKKRMGYTLDLPLSCRGDRETILKSHRVIFRTVWPIIESGLPRGVSVVFKGFSFEELKGE